MFTLNPRQSNFEDLQDTIEAKYLYYGHIVENKLSPTKLILFGNSLYYFLL